MIFNAEIERALAEAVDDYDSDEPLHDFINRTLAKRELDEFIAELVDEYGAHAIASVLDMIKTLGFKLRDAGRHHDLEERHRHPAGQGGDPRRVRGARPEGRARSTSAA